MAEFAKSDFVPGPGVPERTPQLLRDKKPVRPGVPEVIGQMPIHLAIPLLIAKAHSELHEVAEDFRQPEEFADVDEVLRALAAACGLEWDDVVEEAAEVHSSLLEFKDVTAYHQRLLLAGRIHGKIEAIGRDLRNLRRHAEALECLWSLAEACGINWEEVDILGDDKRERLGGFRNHMLWCPASMVVRHSKADVQAGTSVVRHHPGKGLGDPKHRFEDTFSAETAILSAIEAGPHDGDVDE